MKEIMLPYILITWLLFKFKILKPTGRNYFITTSIGILLALTLFLGHRFYSPADLTNSTTVKAPHAVLSPAIGQQIDKIFIDHNQIVAKGDVLYQLKDDKITSAMSEVRSAKIEIDRTIDAKLVALAQAKRNHIRHQGMNEHVSPKDLEESADLVDTLNADLAVLQAQKLGLKAQQDNLNFELARLTVTAPFDGMVTHIYIADGSRIGSLHLWDINKKFIEMRIPDQAYKHIQKGQFSEFFVHAYPGEIFRARVHSVVNATGEAQGSLLPQEQSVAQHIQRGAAPVGRTVILEIDAETMAMLPIGATGSAWISAEKPHSLLGFLDIIGGATVRLTAVKSYLQAL
ncbi:efflux RND transporter periplasmic adaptor subunit [Shewanella colwelliana]|uniref:HlyD family secretion protein n=1 Tax=Shewanella colwelliana TaxID=23 RepID=UPI00299DA84F|nr:efflux RND transporter periplasmic adaptor subunit [Shewanella colwelliana]MDX1282236.1 efflux RND transporter periplasmic adaptor subunit [Shewanella colwelliana]